MLQFAGVGGAFDTHKYPSSAFFIGKRKDFVKEYFLFIIDAGGGILHRYKELWENTPDEDKSLITRIYINITHLHADHVGDLSTLIYYFKLKAKIDDIRIMCHANLSEALFRRMGEEGLKDDVPIIRMAAEPWIFDGFEVSYVKNKHIKGIKSYSLIIREKDSNEITIYSGDTKKFVLYNPKLISILAKLENGLNTKKVNIYQEVTLDKEVECHTHLYVIPSIDETKEAYLDVLGFDNAPHLKEVSISLYHFDSEQLNKEELGYIERTGLTICGVYPPTKFKLP